MSTPAAVPAPTSTVRVASPAVMHSLLDVASAVGGVGSAHPSLDALVSSSAAAVAARVFGSGDAAAASGGLSASFK
ncbi:hypothetical protein SUGI_0690550 [Cryptomeria japonica]|nr:hypothetical protein SUGI_0690550 [Cryptomeria japonica]